MARLCKTKVKVLIECWEYDTGAGAAAETKRLLHKVDKSYEFDSGSTDYTEIDRVWSTAAGVTTTPTDLDLMGTANLPSKLDAGNNVNFSDIVVVCLTNEEAAETAGTINIGGGSNPFADMWLAAGDGLKVPAQGLFLFVAPGGVQPAAGTADVLRVVASESTLDAKLLLAGRAL